MAQDKRLTQLARHMRHKPTPSERLLWNILRDRRMEGEKFRRQSVREPFITDFLCERLGLVIELDGAGHERTVQYDLERKQRLQQEDLTVLRFGSEILVSDGADIPDIIRQEILRLRKEKRLAPLSPRERAG